VTLQLEEPEYIGLASIINSYGLSLWDSAVCVCRMLELGCSVR